MKVKYRSAYSILFFVGSTALASSAMAQDAGSTVFDSFQLTGGLGAKNVYANEFVYNTPSGTRLSQLVWKSQGMATFDLGFEAEFKHGWTAKGQFEVGFGGTGHMTDYDWISPYNTGLGDNDWSDRSLHSDTRLDHSFAGSLEVGKNVFQAGNTTFNLGAGFKYTDIQWSAWGGTYIYSTAATRDTVGSFGSSTQVITYRQKLPVIYAGLNASTQSDAWTLEGAIKGGVTVGAEDQDDHWQRNLRFIDTFSNAPVLSLSASASYQLKPTISLFVTASYDKIFTVTGNTATYNTGGGAPSYSTGSAGLDFESAAIKVGIKGKF